MKNFNNENILIAGIGGGFDIFSGLPFLYQLKQKNNVFLANYSFSDLNSLVSDYKISESLFEVSKKDKDYSNFYFPEYFLSEYLEEFYKEKIPIYCFEKTGVVPLYNSLKKIIEEKHINKIILVDGGFDSIMKDFSKNNGTILEDFISLAAINKIINDYFEIEINLICCGYGTEVEEKIDFNKILNNISEIENIDVQFFNKKSKEFIFYKNAYKQVISKNISPSHIQGRIIDAVEGKFGKYSGVDYNCFMSLFYIFDAKEIISKNTVLHIIDNTYTFNQVVELYKICEKNELLKNLINI